jgi:hypothetical protein
MTKRKRTRFNPPTGTGGQSGSRITRQNPVTTDEGGTPDTPRTVDIPASDDVDVPLLREEQPASEEVVRPLRRRNATQPRQFNLTGLVLVIIVIVIAVLALQRFGAPAPVAPSDGRPDTVETGSTGNDNCPDLVLDEALMFDGAVIRVTEQRFLLARPSVNSSTVRDLVVLTGDDLTIIDDQTTCESDTYWMNVSLPTSSGTARGWIPVYSGNRWFITVVSAPVAPPVATEDADSDGTWTRGDTLNAVRVGAGNCTPALSPSQFYNANLDSDPNWDGFWVWSSENPGGLFVRNAAGLNAAHLMIDGEVVKIAVNEPLEVRLHDDGFHYSCMDGMVWWSVVFHHIPTNRSYNGWVAEGNDSVDFIVGAE